MIRRALDDGFLADLQKAVGKERVDVSPLTREAYARDLSTLGHLQFRWHSSGVEGAEPPPPPQVVVRPTDARGVEAVVKLCVKEGVPLIPWGAGSGVCGGTYAPQGGVALDLKALDRLVELDRRSLLVTVEPGMNLQLLEDALEREGYTLGHLPSSITCSTIGGAIAS